MPDWVFHLENFLGRYERALLSWSGFGIAAIAVSLVTFLSNLFLQAHTTYRQRYTSRSLSGFMKELRNALRPTLESLLTKIACAAWAIVFLVALGVTVYSDHMELVRNIHTLNLENNRLRSRLTQAPQAGAIPAIQTVGAPLLKVLYQGNPFNGQTLGIIGENGLFELASIQLRNDGDQATAPALSVRLYFSQEVGGSATLMWDSTRSDDSRYPVAFFWVVHSPVSPKETWNVPEFISNGTGITGPVHGRIKAYYGGPAPAEADFIVRRAKPQSKPPN
jgi:hypothetical protein